MLVHDRVFNHYKYMSWDLNYLYDMYELPEKKADLHQYFMSGFHSVTKQNIV